MVECDAAGRRDCPGSARVVGADRSGPQDAAGPGPVRVELQRSARRQSELDAGSDSNPARDGVPQRWSECAPAAEQRTVNPRQRGPGNRMIRRVLIAISMATLVAVGSVPGAGAQMLPGVPANPAEQAYIQRYHDTWMKLNPMQRQTVLENLRRWQQMSPEQRYAAQRNFEEFRRLPPEERRQVLQAMREYRQLPPERRAQLQQAYSRFRALPPAQRQELLDRYRRFQQMPPQQRQHMLMNYQRWQQMSPMERGELRQRWRQAHPFAWGGPHWHHGPPGMGNPPGPFPGAHGHGDGHHGHHHWFW